MKDGVIAGALLPKDLVNRLDKEAAAEGLSRSHVMRRILERHFRNKLRR